MKRPVGVPETSSTGGVAAGEEGDTQRPLKKAHEGEAEATGSGRGQGDNGEAGAVPGGEAATGDAAPLLEGTSTREGTALGQPPVLVTGTAGSGVVAGKGTGERGKVRVRGAAAEDKGSRHTMEDTWLVLDDVAAAAEAEADWRQKGSQKAQSAALGFPFRCSFYAIFDGHGGRKAAEYARANLLETVLASGFPRESVDVKATKKAILEGFKRTDEGLLKESAAGNWQDGATAVCVWVLDRKVFVANIGDAKAVLARHADPGAPPPSPSPSSPASASASPAAGVSSPIPPSSAAAATAVRGGAAGLGASPGPSVSGGRVKGIVVTREHKALFPTERARVEKMGGSVVNGRIQGRLEVSRAFGDRLFKKAGVSAVPDVNVFGLTERERFLIIGCDGLWGVFGPTDAVEFAAALFEKSAPVESVAKQLVKEAVRERKCKDNCTAIVISFGHST